MRLNTKTESFITVLVILHYPISKGQLKKRFNGAVRSVILLINVKYYLWYFFTYYI